MTVEQIIADYGAYVRQQAKRLAHNARMTAGLDADDLYSVGTVAAVDAWVKYDPSRGSFINFARTRIVGAMWDEIRRSSFASRVAIARGTAVSMYSGREEDFSPLDVLADKSLPLPGVESEDEIDNILKPLQCERDRRIVRAVVCYGVPQKRVAQENGLTRSRVSQIVQNCLEYLATVTPSNYLEMA